MHGLHRQLALRVERPDTFHFITEELYPIGQFVGKRVDIHDSAAYGKFARLRNEIDTFKAMV